MIFMDKMQFYKEIRQSRDKVITELLKAKPLTRSQIVAKTGIPRTPVIYSIERIGAEVVKKIYSGHRGRPQVVFGFKEVGKK